MPAPSDSTLDPTDWAAFAGLAHRLLDQALDHLRTVRERPVWQPVPDAVRQALATPLPLEGRGAEATAAVALRSILPYATGNIHPRFFGWVHGAGTAGNLLAEILAATMNANLGGRDHGAIYVERQVIEWCRQLFGLPVGTSGLLVSGTSMATLIGLAVARHHQAGCEVRTDGVGAVPARLVGYASSEAHGSVVRAFEILGLGRSALRSIPVGADYRMDVAELQRAIAADRRLGCKPFCVVATAGTVNTGAIDDLGRLAEIAAEHGLWLHVDGAFGALAILSPEHRPALAGIERADSLAFDFHKWLHVQYDAGCVLVRRGDLHRDAFALHTGYLERTTRGLAGGEPWFCDFGPELSRGFRALKVWFTLEEHGTRRLGRGDRRELPRGPASRGPRVRASALAPAGAGRAQHRLLPLLAGRSRAGSARSPQRRDRRRSPRERGRGALDRAPARRPRDPGQHHQPSYDRGRPRLPARCGRRLRRAPSGRRAGRDHHGGLMVRA